MSRTVLLYLLLLAITAPSLAQGDADPPNVLIVTAHPDDEAGFAGTVYKITHDLGGNVDLALVTNGEGGYKYSTLAEDVYGLQLTDEEIGRQYLPKIRKQELMAGGDIIGIRNYFFFDQKDHMYMLDADTTLGFVWDTALVKERLLEIVLEGEYDYLFCMMPTEGTHGHHKAATIMALRTVMELPEEIRPVVLAGTMRSLDETESAESGTGLPDYPETSIRPDAFVFEFDRTQKFGYKDRLDYRIIANWLIAEHKSQGTMQLLMNRGDIERYYFFDMNDPAMVPRTRALFERLKMNHFPTLEY